MPKRLTWNSDKLRWQKMYKGQVYRSAKCRKSDRKAEQRAWEAFVKFRNEIDQRQETEKLHRREYEMAIATRNQMIEWIDFELHRLSGDNFDDPLEYLTQTILRTSIRTQDDSGGSREALENYLQELLSRNPRDDDNTEGIDRLALARKALELMDQLAKGQKLSKQDREQLFLGQIAIPKHQWRQLVCERAQAQLKSDRSKLKREITFLQKNFQKTNPPELDRPETLPVCPIEGLDRQAINIWSERFIELGKWKQHIGATEHAESVAANIERYLIIQKKREAAGEIKASTLLPLENRLKFFKEHSGHLSIQRLNESAIREFHSHLQSKIDDEGEDKISPTYGKNIWKETKAFCNWLWEDGILESPIRNLRRLKIKVPDPLIKTFDTSVLKDFLAASTNRTKLYLLLAMNCGMTQADISDLTQEEINWSKGRLRRKRTKTADHKNVPTVDYPLWSLTLSLLKQQRSSGNRVLLTEKGNELLRKEQKENGKVTNNDAIIQAFNRVRKKLKVKGLSFKNIRKTSASLLESHPEHSRFVQLFLGHAPATISEKHYAQYDQVGFDKAIMWLGQKYGIESLIDNTPSNDTSIETFTITSVV